jgi:hypothetical protein
VSNTLAHAWYAASEWAAECMGNHLPSPLRRLEPVIMIRHWDLMADGRYDDAAQLRDHWSDALGAFCGLQDNVSEMLQALEDLRATAGT